MARPSVRARLLGTPRRTFLAAFLLCWAIGLCWDAASPPFSGPDEPAHVLRAYTAGRGEIVGPDGPFVPGIIGRTTTAEVPRSLGDLSQRVGCFAFQSQVVAACATSGEVGSGNSTYVNTAGRTPPLYHLVVSPPLEVLPRLLGLYLARAISAGIVAALVAGAVTAAATRRLFGTVTAVFLACTPMVWFLGSVLNPSGVEIASAIGLWVAGIAVLHDWQHDRAAGRGAVALLAASGVGLALMRSLGPLWIAVIGGVLLLLAGMTETHRQLLRDRGLRIAGAIVALATAAQLVWLATAGALESEGEYSSDTILETLGHSLGRQASMWHSMFANFGFLDTRPPEGVSVVWAACWFLFLLVALALVRRRERALLLGLFGVAILVPAVVEASQWNEIGPVWQGRYTLPLLVGVPILSGWAIDRNREQLPIASSLLRLAIVTATIAHASAYWFALRRYAVGTDGKVWFFRDDTWLTWKLIPVTVAGLTAIAISGWAAREIAPSRSRDHVGSPDGAPEPAGS